MSITNSIQSTRKSTPSNQKSQWSEAEVAAANASYKSLYSFTRNFWSVLNTDPYEDNWHVKYLCNELQRYVEAIAKRKEIPDLIINIPPGMSKSTIVSQMFPAFLWLHAPWAKIISTSYNGDLSVAHALKSRAVITSELYIRWFGPLFEPVFGKPMYITKQNDHLLANNHGGSRFVTSTSGAVTGHHAHVILRDDPVDPFKVESPAYRKQEERFNDRTLPTRKTNQKLTPTITVMQRVHAEDTTGREIQKGLKVRHICLPAELSKHVRPAKVTKHYVDGLLDPNRLDQSVLNTQLVTLGAYAYAGQYQQTPTPEGGGYFQRKWFRTCQITDLPDVPTNFAVDGAYTESKQNDYTAVVAYKIYAGNVYIVAATRVRKEMPALLKWLPEWCKGVYGYSESSKVLIEPKGPGLSMIQSFKASGAINAVAGPIPVKDKIARAVEVSPLVEAGRVTVVSDNSPWQKDFFAEIEAFPNSNHDDQVDCLEIILNAEILQLQTRFFNSMSATTVLYGKDQARIDKFWPLYVSVEFHPYHASALIYQNFTERKGGIFVIAEHRVLGGMDQLAPLLHRYRDHPNLVYFTADASGTKQSMAKNPMGGGQYHTEFTQLMQALDVGANMYIDTRRTNHNWIISRNLCNAAFQQDLVLINEKCDSLIVELSSANAKEDTQAIEMDTAMPNSLANAFRYIIHSQAPQGIKSIQQLRTIVHGPPSSKAA